MAGVTCNVILNVQECKAPPASEVVGGIRATCFSCGQHTCTACSTVRPYLHYGKKRICNDCAEHLEPRP